MKVDSIIAVKDVELSSKWYQSVFNLTSRHGGDTFDILVNKDNEVIVCLHKWGEHDHPTMESPSKTAGNGLILYFRTEDIAEIRERLRDMKYEVESEIELSQNSRRNEFSFWDPDGYFIIVSEFHDYEGDLNR